MLLSTSFVVCRFVDNKSEAPADAADELSDEV